MRFKMRKLHLLLVSALLILSVTANEDETNAVDGEDLAVEASNVKQVYATPAPAPAPAYAASTQSSYQTTVYEAQSSVPMPYGQQPSGYAAPKPAGYGVPKPAGYAAPKPVAAAPMYRNVSTYNSYESYSPWRGQPGSYTRESYGGGRYQSKQRYSAHSVYASYLNSGPYEAYSKQCARSYGRYPQISYDDLGKAFGDALQRLNQYNAYEQQQYKAGNYMNVSVYSSAARHQVATYVTQQNAEMYFKEKEAIFMEFASRYLLKYNCLSKLDAHYLLPQVKVGPKTGNPYGDNSCYAAYGMPGNELHCRDSKYRTLDGSCNNLYHPYWGKASVCHLRLVPPAYEDGIQTPRMTSAYGGPLPSARVITTTAHQDRPDRSYYTHLKMVWGQYINHDITFTPTSHAGYQGGMIKCCPDTHHPQCMPIHIPSNDYYQGKYKKTCMNFVRSAPCPLCTLGPRQQTNIATSFLDNGATYGDSIYNNKRLRTGKMGYLRTQLDRCGREIMPPTASPWEDQCSSQYPGMKCFDAGDPRVNQQPALQMVHTLWLRQHNKHARNLAHVNPKWGDDKLFEEARRIVIAQLQYITYSEYLPIVFGPTLMKYFDLDVTTPGYTRYEPYTDPTTWNDYAAAACRFGHSQISNFFSLVGYPSNYTNQYQYGRDGNKPGFWLRDWFFDPKLMYDCQIDPMVKGLLSDHSMVVDPFIGNDIKNYLYRTKKEPVGSDLPAFNIQRGRDHGIPPYHVYLKFCFGFEATSWDDLGKFIPYEQLYVFKKVYKDWRDVEFWPAGISEHKFPDADVGPTFACVLGIQYYHLKFGDRYFFSHGHQTGSFNPMQLANLRQATSLSSFLCENADYLDGVQKYAFFPAAGYNPVIPCKNRQTINYNLWKEGY